MIIDSEEYINMPITTYLENMLQVVGYTRVPIDYQPVILYVLSSTLLQMTGFLEKKLDMIAWHIAHNDFEYRNNLIRNTNSITPNFKKINEIYNYLMNTKNKSITQEKVLLKTAYDNIIDLFQDTIFINYTNSEFFVFKNNYPNGIPDNELENLYQKTFEYRHTIAHNINSVYKDHLSIGNFAANKDLYLNNYARFTILSYIDLVLIDKFKEYNLNNATIKFLD